ncbi:MAG: LysR family transcriptional regulator [Microbacteriaceae bacterium]
MHIERLRLLRELGDRGSVAAVAAALHVSPSAVSQQLAALQREVPQPLTARRGRVLVLTPSGEALAAASVRVEEALELARGTVDALAGDERRTVTVSAFHSAGLLLFAPLLRRLDGAVPVALRDADVALERFPGLTADHDLVIAHRLSHDPGWPTERMRAVALFTEPVDVALHAAHPLAAQAGIRPEQLRDERWVAVHDGFPLAGVLQHWGAMSGAPLRIEHRVNEFSLAAAIVRTGAAIAALPRTTGASLAVDGMVLRPVVGSPIVRHVDVLARPDVLAQAAVRRVLDELLEVARSTAA